ncbi:RNA polymerase recycling motor HelD [Bacillus solitudinis]|uniref:RNA polymerase recycling motor HelD n=1 Tax=Bacillus solitudinis TaxID=2014074 RepID=UPI000C24E961|nr:RNA polymerase recycling motor HelD [Bacillus solitudinis]
MDNKDRNLQEEQERVDSVVAQIGERIEELKVKVGGVKEDVVDIRKKFWDDVTVNLENAEETAETVASIKQQAEVLSEQERRHQHDVKQLRSLHRLKDKPYFGKIIFTEEDETAGEAIYIGTASFVDRNGVDFYVYDWRAPISSLYYDSGPGTASYETPVGTISGTIDEKLQFIIRQAKIEHMFTTGITIGDEMLQEVLGEQANSQMKSIVATIQQEQNQIIRNERCRILIVQGVAGSGKTSAALQRVAYLLYRYRTTLQADQIVLFSPNPMFNSYIGSVLPELGEENMQQTTFQDYIEHRLGDEFSLEDGFSQMEYVLTDSEKPEYFARLEGIKFKSSIRFMEEMDVFVEKLNEEGLAFKKINLKGEVLFSNEMIETWFYELDPTLSIPNRINLVCERLLKELREMEKQERRKEWVEREIELLDKESYLYAFNRVSKQNEDLKDDSFYDYDREEEILKTMVIKRHFKKVRHAIKKIRFLDAPKIYMTFLKEISQLSDLKDGREMFKQATSQIEKGVLPFEDATPFLYLKGKIEGFEMNTIIRHVFIDEAQDYSPFQFAFIKSMFPRAKMTVLGDKHQSIYTHSLLSSFQSSLQSLFKHEEIESYELTKSYRSTKQITECTKSIIDADIEPFNREGNKPIITRIKQDGDLYQWLVKRVSQLRDERKRTVAIICKTAQECVQAYEQLKELLSIRLMTKTSTGYDEGTLIIPSYLAKGVEFDAVIVYNASSYVKESERHLFYTVCTRAMHNLDICYKDVFPFLKDIPKETYIEDTKHGFTS